MEGETEEVRGPVDVALIAQYESIKTTKVAVFGNAYFATDGAISHYYPNSYSTLMLMARTVDWMYDKTNDVFVLPKVLI